MSHRRRSPIGSRPGTLAIPADAPPPRVRVFEYAGEICREHDVENLDDLRRYRDADETAWVDVQGFGDEDKLWEIASIFGLHPLTLESATNVPQPARVDRHDEHLLLIARLPEAPEGHQVATPQVCMVLGRGWILTFQDRAFGFFDPIRERLREGRGPIRDGGADYLLYALLDAMVDRYFPVAESLSAILDDLEDEVSEDPQPDALHALQNARRALVTIRRIGFAQLEALRSLTQHPEPFIRPENGVYLRSTEQHLAQGMGIVESEREHASALVELYLSTVSQRTNEVMKVLTLMASIFIPLTFIAGIYGMNFETMPELRNPWGYPAALVTMVVLAVAMILWFRHKGWIGHPRKRKRPE